MMFRLGAVVLACVALFFLPAWMVILACAAFALRYPAWEMVLVGLFVDVLYAPHLAYFGVPLPATVLLFVVVLALTPWRRQLAV